MKTPVAAHQRRDFLGWQRRNALNEHDMEANAKRWQPPRAVHRIGHGRPRDHQAGGGENSGGMGALHRFVHRDIGAKIIRGHNQAGPPPYLLPANGRLCGQATSFLRRRKSKNSTPSRRRRFIMSQSRSISPTISAILLGRK